jgi:short-subunit dehydrogenase
MKFYEGKTVWVIGGTSGIGLAIAQMLSAIQTCNVIVSGRDTSKVSHISNIHKVTLDVSNQGNFTQAADEILQKHAKIDAIFFCAGAYDPMNIDTFNRESARNILETNLGSMVNFVENIPKFYGKCSTIAIVSSVAGYFGMPNSLFYGASKAGLSHLVESLYIELKKHKIDVKLVNPGFVKTPMTDKNSFNMPFIISPQKAADTILRQVTKNKFEIAFPLMFVLILKTMRMIPVRIRAKILRRAFSL